MVRTERQRMAVHPRACGEHFRMRLHSELLIGSSPRLRGTPRFCIYRDSNLRFIPAPAGNAVPSLSSKRKRSVHPRACGERDLEASVPMPLAGSSPRLRGTPSKMPCLICWTTVHPRACGERQQLYGEKIGGSGSSPRLRGTHLHHRAALAQGRFIPAPAGNAAGRLLFMPAGKVHPRACGERAPSQTTASMSAGSSPRLRGTRIVVGRLRPDGRFIPAPAGNARSIRPIVLPATVHPRACGERHDQLVQRHVGDGSSPRLRGTQLLDLHAHSAARFIPAPAGNARYPGHGRMAPPVHPRACGERQLGLGPVKLAVGSSPRLRGTHNQRYIKSAPERFIPAPAGNAPISTVPRRCRAVHPRACGERFQACLRKSRTAGSSPRLRGTRFGRLRLGAGWRFIPAPAGNAVQGSTGSRHQPVHPRACGERRSARPLTCCAHGSSPRLRGTHRQRQAAHRDDRFIPAPAGNARDGAVAGECVTVHPRACGERWWSLQMGFQACGSSPRLRGTPDPHRALGRMPRFIPAPAGNACAWRR